ncbi:MAG: SURF1 family protein [Candidatus Planktophila sp.]|nr:SURF1 family protein [Candidatus Planktophila sp.]
MANQQKSKEPQALFKTLIALLLITGCLWASQWQYQRGIDRHQRNSAIEAALLQPIINLEQVTDNAGAFEWRTIETSGEFDVGNQILLKNRYFEGVYGYEVLTRFQLTDGRNLWVDRGWVKAGKDAKTAPVISPIPSGEVSIKARLRLDRSLPQGAFFALPATGAGMISKLNAQSGLKSEGFYLDLIGGTDPLLAPKVTAQVPELTDGPHLAYALQWIFFAGLIAYGRILIRRGQILTSKEL